jgi:hypothetical protein
MIRQDGLVRLRESAEDRVDPDRFHVYGVGHPVLVLAEQRDCVFPRFCLSGELDKQASIFPGWSMFAAIQGCHNDGPKSGKHCREGRRLMQNPDNN